MEIKTFASRVELKASPEGKFKALISSFGIPDKSGDTVKRGAFQASLREWRASNGRIPVIYSHEWDNPSMTIGEVNPHDAMETDRGFRSGGGMLFQRGGVRVESSNSHADYFIRDLTAIRAEIRVALVLTRPVAYGKVTGLNPPA